MTDIKFDIIKTRVNAPVRELKATWTFEEIQLSKWKKYPHDSFAAYKIYDSQVWGWVEDQPIHMWKYDDAGDGNNYLFTEEMEVLFLLRWS